MVAYSDAKIAVNGSLPDSISYILSMYDTFDRHTFDVHEMLNKHALP